MRPLLSFVPLVLLIMLGAFRPAALHAQASWEGFGIEANVMAGRMIRHTPKFTGPISDRVYGGSLNFLKQTYGQKQWQQRRRFPLLGFGLVYLNYNNKEVYGQVVGLYPLLQIPLLRLNDWEWTFRAGMGVGYVDKHYERLPRPNTENVAIGGHWNNVSPFAMDLRWRYDAHWQLQVGLDFCHVSNAAFQQPNLGINTWGLHLGARYFPVNGNPEPIVDHLPPLPNRWSLQGRASVAFIEASQPGGPTYPVYIGAVYGSKRYWSKNKVYAGLDYYFNKAKYMYWKSKDHYPGEEGKHSEQVAAFLGNEFQLGRVGLVFQLGYYLKQMPEQNERMYQKIGGQFYFLKKEDGYPKEVFFSALLKTHMGTAELFEMGLGFGL